MGGLLSDYRLTEEADDPLGKPLNGARQHDTLFNHFSMTPSNSLSRRIVCCLSSMSTSVPLYLPNTTVSPFLTVSGVRLPLSLNLPGPTATILPVIGFSFAPSGK